MPPSSSEAEVELLELHMPVDMQNHAINYVRGCLSEEMSDVEILEELSRNSTASSGKVGSLVSFNSYILRRLSNISLILRSAMHHKKSGFA